MSSSVATCPHCTNTTRLRNRDFSDQAWAALLAWEEIDKSVVGKPLCDGCYSEVREVLIDRAEEISTAQPAQKKPKRTGRKVKKAS